MTEANAYAPLSYVGNGVTTVFNAPDVAASSELVVILVTAAGARLTQTLNVDYTYNPATEQITMATAPAVGQTLIVARETDLTQLLDLEPLARLPAEAVEAAFDKLTRIAQELKEEVGRSARIEVGGTQPPLAATEGAFLQFDDGEIVADTTIADIVEAAAAVAQPPTLTGLTFSTRAAFVAAVAGGYDPAEGSVVWAAGVGYRRDSAATGLPNLTGWAAIAPTTPEHFGALGDGVADDTVAMQAALDFIGDAGGGTLELHGVYGISADVKLKFGSVRLVGRGWGSGFVSLSGSPVVSCLLADRDAGAVSIEGVHIENFQCEGVGIFVERFTRGCVIRGVQVRNFVGHGIRIKNSWSYILEGCRVTNCTGTGVYMEGANNDMAATGNQIVACGFGWVVEDAQGGQIEGNAAEYNFDTNFTCSANGMAIINNYFEGFDPSVSGVAGSKYCVVLGSVAKPFHNSEFFNYVNGGSNSGAGFNGDGVYLVNVRECRLGGSFSLSTRFPFAFDETSEINGNEFILSFDNITAVTRAATIRNLTAGVTGGVTEMKGTNVYGNRAVQAGDDLGLRMSHQIEPNGTTGSLCEWRVAWSGTSKFRFGKLSSAIDAFDFVSDTGRYRFTSGRVAMIGLPTSSVGLSAGDLWNDAGTVKVVI